jgi:tetratricopeptide (TPR) repeat protein
MNRILPKTLIALICFGWVTASVGRGAEAQAASPAASAPRGRLLLVTWYGPGSIALPQGAEWKPEMLTLYDNGRRPVAQFSNDQDRVSLSYILFENKSGTPTAQGCREDAINPITKKYGKVIYKRSDKNIKLEGGVEAATTAYTLDTGDAKTPHQRNLFAFAGNATTCAEVHVSSPVDSADEAEQMQKALAEFRPNVTYKPAAIDLFQIGQLLFKTSPGFSAPYYRASLDAMPADGGFIAPRRITTDQLVMALGMSGDLKGSRELAEKAVAADPDYPINYYNLACADAEQGDAVNARKHLQAAYDRRQNVLAGEKMPDAASDDSILKLKGNKDFWEFVMSLPKS